MHDKVVDRQAIEAYVDEPEWERLLERIEEEDEFRCTECNGRAWGWCGECTLSVVRAAYEAGRADAQNQKLQGISFESFH